MTIVVQIVEISLVNDSGEADELKVRYRDSLRVGSGVREFNSLISRLFGI